MKGVLSANIQHFADMLLQKLLPSVAALRDHLQRLYLLICARVQLRSTHHTSLHMTSNPTRRLQQVLAFATAAMASPSPSERTGAQAALAVMCEGGAGWMRKRMDDQILPLVMAGLQVRG
jgi:hypothetical protein